MAESQSLYQAIEPFNTGMLPVSDLHTIYYEESGNPAGVPVVILHGGPGGGSRPIFRRLFDPQRWRIIQFDQRGCGQSTPHAELTDNTTWHLVADMELLREHLGIESWIISGGSWGSTLALAYGETHPARCRGFILRGVFMLRPEELIWYYQAGAVEGDTRAGPHQIFPELWDDYLAPIPVDERGDMMNAYYRRLTGTDPAERRAAAHAWSTWEGRTSKLITDLSHGDTYGEEQFADAFARIECHYFVNGGFFDPPDQLLQNAGVLADKHCIIVQGRYDLVCPPRSAWELDRVWTRADLRIIEGSGHSWSEPGIQAGLVRAGNDMLDA